MIMIMIMIMIVIQLHWYRPPVSLPVQIRFAWINNF